MQIDTNLLGGSRSWQDAIFLSVGKVGLSFIFDDSPYQGGKSSQRPLFSYTHGVRVALMGMDWAFLSGRFAACHNQEDMKGLYCNFVGGNMVDFLTNSKTDRDVPNLPSASGSYMPALAASSTTAGDKTKNDGFKLPYSHRGMFNLLYFIGYWTLLSSICTSSTRIRLVKVEEETLPFSRP